MSRTKGCLLNGWITPCYIFLWGGLFNHLIHLFFLVVTCTYHQWPLQPPLISNLWLHISLSLLPLNLSRTLFSLRLKALLEISVFWTPQALPKPDSIFPISCPRIQKHKAFVLLGFPLHCFHKDFLHIETHTDSLFNIHNNFWKELFSNCYMKAVRVWDTINWGCRR